MKRMTALFFPCLIVGLLVGLVAPPQRVALARPFSIVKTDTTCLDSRYPCDNDASSEGHYGGGETSCGPNQVGTACWICTSLFGDCIHKCNGAYHCDFSKNKNGGEDQCHHIGGKTCRTAIDGSGWVDGPVWE